MILDVQKPTALSYSIAQCGVLMISFYFTFLQASASFRVHEEELQPRSVVLFYILYILTKTTLGLNHTIAKTKPEHLSVNKNSTDSTWLFCFHLCRTPVLLFLSGQLLCANHRRACWALVPALVSEMWTLFLFAWNTGKTLTANKHKSVCSKLVEMWTEQHQGGFFDWCEPWLFFCWLMIVQMT